MSWETRVVLQHSFNRKTYDSYVAVENDYEESQALLKSAKDELLQLATLTDLSALKEEDNSDVLLCVKQRVDNALEIIEEETTNSWILKEMMDTWDKSHDDKDRALVPHVFIDGIENEDPYYGRVFIDGDFVPTTEYDPHESIIGISDEVK